MNLNKIEAAAKTYLLLAAPLVFAAYVSGHTNPKTLAIVAAAAILGPVARAMNPKDAAYGIVSAAAAEVSTLSAAALAPVATPAVAPVSPGAAAVAATPAVSA